jgi:predicted DCC family thiol-disulfide oxidoreductase YuxK
MTDSVPSKDQVEALITRVLGERCADYDANCMTCQAWRMRDELIEAARRTGHEPGVHRCDDEHAPVYYDGDDCPVCDVLGRWMSEANAPRTTPPPRAE